MLARNFKNKGFTIVELLIVIVIIAILAAVAIVAYSGIQERARNTKILADIKQVHKLIEAYNAEHGEYPKTTSTVISGGTSGSTGGNAMQDTNCARPGGQSDWVPGLDATLPQSDGNTGGGSRGDGGCYLYMSDGTSYILSAWNMLKSPQTSTMYRRLGFREISNAQYYYCNQINIGGSNPTPYTLSRDYYKYSYTVSNIGWCNETPPTDA